MRIEKSILLKLHNVDSLDIRHRMCIDVRVLDATPAVIKLAHSDTKYEQIIDDKYRIDQLFLTEINVDSEGIRGSLDSIVSCCKIVAIHVFEHDLCLIQGIEVDESAEKGFTGTKARDTKGRVTFPVDWQTKEIPFMATLEIKGRATSLSQQALKDVFQSWH